MLSEARSEDDSQIQRAPRAKQMRWTHRSTIYGLGDDASAERQPLGTAFQDCNWRGASHSISGDLVCRISRN
jgi:hypothetical protein